MERNSIPFSKASNLADEWTRPQMTESSFALSADDFRYLIAVKQVRLDETRSRVQAHTIIYYLAQKRMLIIIKNFDELCT